MATLSMHHSRQAAGSGPHAVEARAPRPPGREGNPACGRPPTPVWGLGGDLPQVRVTWDPRCSEHKATGAVQGRNEERKHSCGACEESSACGRRSVWSPALHVKEAFLEGGGSWCNGRLFNHCLRPVSLPV